MTMTFSGAVKAVIRWGLVLACLLLAAAAVSSPVQQHLMGYPAGEQIYAALGPICHQYPTRSFWIFGRPFALCARCTMGYAGTALGIGGLSLWQLRGALPSWTYPAGVAGLLVGVGEPLLRPALGWETTTGLRAVFGLIGGLSLGICMHYLTASSSHDR
jgi:uncharacterized membrane protein